MNKKSPKQNEDKNKKTALHETMETKNEVLRFEPGNYDKIALFASSSLGICFGGKKYLPSGEIF